MSKHIIFVIHGMGQFTKGWSDDVAKQIKDLYSTYQIATLLPFDDFFRVQEITYGQRFDSLRRQWRENSTPVLKIMKENGLQKSAAKELAEYGAMPASDNFVATHLLDVFLYGFVPTLGGCPFRS